MRTDKSRQLRPAVPFLASTSRTSLRVSHQTLEALERIGAVLARDLLDSSSLTSRRAGWRMTVDSVLRTVLATFARDYKVQL